MMREHWHARYNAGLVDAETACSEFALHCWRLRDTILVKASPWVFQAEVLSQWTKRRPVKPLQIDFGLQSFYHVCSLVAKSPHSIVDALLHLVHLKLNDLGLQSQHATRF